MRNWVRSRSGVFFSILFPVMLLLVFATVFGASGSGRYTLYVQNLDMDLSGADTDLSSSFVRALNQSGAFDLKAVPYDADARSYVQERLGVFGGTFRLLILPRGFQSDMLNGSLRARLGVVSVTTKGFLEQSGALVPPDQQAGIRQGLQQLERALEQTSARNVTMLYVADPSNSGSTIVQSILDNIAKAFNYRVIGVTANIRVDVESVAERRYRSVDYYLPGLLAAFVMTNGVIGVTTNTTEFKRQGILKRLATTPLSRMEWVLGNVLSQTLLSFLLSGVMIFTGWLVFGLQAVPDALTIVVIAVGAVMFSGIGLVLAGFLTDVEAASAAGNAVAFPMMFLSGSFWPVEVMPSYLQVVARVLPLTYFADALRSALIFHHLPSALSNLGVVGVLAVVFIFLGAAVTRWQQP